MQLTQVKQNHILDRSTDQISDLCYRVWPQMELPQQLRKQLFPVLECPDPHTCVILCQ